MTQVVLAIDPGREKCGLALVAADETLLERAIVATSEVPARVAHLLAHHAPCYLLLGSGTHSKTVKAALLASGLGEETSTCPIQLVDERHTTERARVYYWKFNPPRGMQRLLPEGLRVPPQPWDDLAAYVMACDFLRAQGLKQDTFG